LLVFALAALGLCAGGGAACSVLLETDTNPNKCNTDADCAGLPNAVCDNSRRHCVTRLPPLGSDGGAPDGSGGTSGLTCQVSFDNRTRVPLDGPDGGLRPLPVTP
jgi:hypothetical protein